MELSATIAHKIFVEAVGAAVTQSTFGTLKSPPITKVNYMRTRALMNYSIEPEFPEG